MAVPIDFPESNLVLGPPPGRDREVTQLPVLRRDGRLVSAWRPNLSEIEEIIRTGIIWLSVWGQATQPPVMVSGFKCDVIGQLEGGPGAA